MAKHVVVLDLAAAFGTAEFIPGVPFDRTNKAALELRCAKAFLEQLGTRSENVRTNEKDPPDVLFEMNGVTIGLELVELLPENRLGKDHRLEGLRNRVLDQLSLGAATRNWVVTVTLADDDSARLPRDAHVHLAAALSAFFPSAKPDDQHSVLSIPPILSDTIKRIDATRFELVGDPRLREPDAPRIVFTAQHTHLVPERDVPDLLEAVVRPKLIQDVTSPVWLLMWSTHPAISAIRDELISYTQQWLATHTLKYDRIFCFQYGAFGGFAEVFNKGA
jgi:hypothetical protein